MNSQDMRRRYEIWLLSVMVMGLSVRIGYMLVFVFKFFIELKRITPNKTGPRLVEDKIHISVCVDHLQLVNWEIDLAMIAIFEHQINGGFN